MPAPVLTPAGPLAKRGKEVQVFTAINGVTSWATSGGTLSATGAGGATWTAPNKSGTFTITATNGSGSTVVTITVIGVCPFNPSRGYTVKNKKKVQLFVPDDGPRQTVQLQGRKRTIEFVCNIRQKAEFEELDAFWDWHYPGKKVYITHPGRGIESLYWIDSDLEEKWDLTNLMGYSFVATEA